MKILFSSFLSMLPMQFIRERTVFAISDVGIKDKIINFENTLFSEAPTVWPPDTKSWLTGKDLHAGKDWGQEKGAAEYEMVGWHHQFNGHEFEQTLGDSGVFLSRCVAVFGVTKSHTWLSDWSTSNNSPFLTAYTKPTWTRSSYGP